MKLRIFIIDNTPSIRQAVFTKFEVEEEENGAKGVIKFKSFLSQLLNGWNMQNLYNIVLLKSLKDKYSNVNLGFITSQITQEMKICAKRMSLFYSLPSHPFTQEQSKWTLGLSLKG